MSVEIYLLNYKQVELEKEICFELQSIILFILSFV